MAMNNPWEHLQDLVSKSVDWIWTDFAKEGEEGAILQPLGERTDAASWVAESLAMSQGVIHRKLGAMLAGWVFDSNYRGLLVELLDRERERFPSEPIDANSVAEDIMFSATRWTTCRVADVKEAGLSVLANMIHDAINHVPWNTAHWAAANLYAVSGKNHPALIELSETPISRITDQPFLARTADALRSGNQDVLNAYHTRPTQSSTLSREDPRFALAAELWEAALKAQAASET